MPLGWRFVVVAAAVPLAGACGGTGDGPGTEPAPQTAEVVAQDFAFDPTSITAAGDILTVSVTNEDDVEHSFTIEEADVDVVVAAGATEEMEVDISDAPLTYICRFHPSMTGTIGSGEVDPGGSGSEQGGMDEGLDY